MLSQGCDLKPKPYARSLDANPAQWGDPNPPSVLEVTSTHGVAVTPAATPAAASQRSFAAPAAAAPPPAVPAEPAVDRPATLSFAAPAAAATPPGVPPSTFRRSPPGTSRPNTAEPKLLAFWLPFLRSNSQATCAVGLQDVAQPAIEITMPGHASPRVPAGAPEPLTHFL